MCIIRPSNPLKSHSIQFIPFSIQNVRTHICMMLLLSHCVCERFKLRAVCICLCRSSACSHSLALAPVLCECALKCGHDSTLIYWFLIIVALLRCGCACSDSVMVFCCFIFFFFFLQSAPYVILHEKKHFFLFSSFDVISRLMHFRSVVAHIFTQCKSISCNLLLLVVLWLRLLTMTEIKKRNELILICLIDRTKPNQPTEWNICSINAIEIAHFGWSQARTRVLMLYNRCNCLIWWINWPSSFIKCDVSLRVSKLIKRIHKHSVQ